MASVKFDVYNLNENGATVGIPIEWDPEVDSVATVAKLTNEVLELRKDKNVVISPNGEEAAYVLGKKKSRGSSVVVPAPVVQRIFELYVEEDQPLSTIKLPLYAEFEGIVVQESTIKKILLGERDSDVEVDADLRKVAAAKLGNGKGRRKYTDEIKQSWCDRHLAGESGSQIAKSEGINSSVVNQALREAGVQQNSRGGTKPVKTTK